MLSSRFCGLLSYFNSTYYGRFAVGWKINFKSRLQIHLIGHFCGQPTGSPRQLRGDLAIPEAPNRNQDGGRGIPSEVVRGASATGGCGRRPLLRNLHRAHSLPDRPAGPGSCVRTTLRRGGGELSLRFRGGIQRHSTSEASVSSPGKLKSAYQRRLV